MTGQQAVPMKVLSSRTKSPDDISYIVYKYNSLIRTQYNNKCIIRYETCCCKNECLLKKIKYKETERTSHNNLRLDKMRPMFFYILYLTLKNVFSNVRTL